MEEGMDGRRECAHYMCVCMPCCAHGLSNIYINIPLTLSSPQQALCVTFQMGDVEQPLYGFSATTSAYPWHPTMVVMFGSPATPKQIRSQKKPAQTVVTLLIGEWCCAYKIFVHEGRKD